MGENVKSPGIRERVETDLRNAIDNGEFELFFQPKYNLINRLPIGVEALLRWRHRSGALLPPGYFIPVAEKSGMIRELGEWVVQRACEDGARMIGDFDTPISVAINLSSGELASPRLSRAVKDALAATTMPPELLEIEISERIIAHGDAEAACGTVAELHDCGIGLVIDGFGCGDAPVAQLLELPITGVKVDRSVISDIHGSETADLQVRTVLALGRVISKIVIAEGIEEDSQADFLLREGCLLGQGYGYSRPVPYEELCDILPARITTGRSAGGAAHAHAV